jgi:hypothetical protein
LYYSWARQITRTAPGEKLGQLHWGWEPETQNRAILDSKFAPHTTLTRNQADLSKKPL